MLVLCIQKLVEPSAEINFIYRFMKSKQSTSNASRSSMFLERFWANREMRYTRLGPMQSSKPHHPPKVQIESDGDIPLQCLDAQLLLMHGKSFGDRSNGSPAGSSLDLEWEHEEFRTSSHQQHEQHQHSWLVLPEDSDVTTSSSSGDSSSASSNQRCAFVQPNPVVATGRKTESRASGSDHWSHRSTPDSLEWDVNEADHERFQSNEDLLDTDTMELLQEIEWLKNRALSETGEACRLSSVTEAES